MPLYLDVHRDVDTSPESVSAGHLSDIEAQDRYGVKYLKYWIDHEGGRVCCLVEGPSPEACEAVHREAHGLLADEIIEVESGLIEQFLGGQQTTELGAVVLKSGDLDPAYRIILFTDIVESTALTQRIGDTGAMEVLQHHDTIARTALSATDGREVKHTGDGIMASFVGASQAIRCATAIQESVARHNEERPERAFKLRIGIAAGEPIWKDADLFGAAVQLAARVCGAARPGEIAVANVVRELCVGKPFAFTDLGAIDLKGFSEPVRLYEVGAGLD
jgi:class 3 adenylate cyclase